jgi:hypothetical protein
LLASIKTRQRATSPLTSLFAVALLRVFHELILGFTLLKLGMGLCRIGEPRRNQLHVMSRDSGFDEELITFFAEQSYPAVQFLINCNRPNLVFIIIFQLFPVMKDTIIGEGR